MYVVDVKKNDKVERKIFLHMIKTAGISVHRSCVTANHTLQYNQRHCHIGILPTKYIELPRHIILRKPEDWYVSFYNFFLPVRGFFSFMLRDDKGLPVDINEFISRALNMKHFFNTHTFKRDILNGILNEQETQHFMFTFFTEQITDETANNYDCSIFDWFWRGTGGDTATVYPMTKDGLAALEEEFNITLGHDNKTEKTSTNIPVTVADINDDTLKLIEDVDSKYYEMLRTK